MEPVADMNNLYEAFRSSMRGSAWKSEPQRFEMNFLSELTALQEELVNRTYRDLPGTEFTIHERGKTRAIHGGRMRDRVLRHSFCDNVIGPALKPYLIYNNGASQKGKGITFARREFERDLHNFYLEHRSNDGYVAFLDLSKFYDNIRHDLVMDMVGGKINEFSRWLLARTLESSRVDVSYMTDEEYAHCLDVKSDSVAYYRDRGPEEKMGTRWMEKSVNIGDQISQDIGVYLPTPIDNYATCVRGHRRYGRYMDDMYIIHHDRAYIEETISGICEVAAEHGFYINMKKTRICKLSDTFTFLQTKYSLEASGRTVKRINPKAVAREHRRIKAYKHLYDEERMDYAGVEQACKSWMGNFYKVMSKKQIKNMKTLYQQNFGKELQWKK